MITIKVKSDDFDFQELKNYVESNSFGTVKQDEVSNFGGFPAINIDIFDVMTLGSFIIGIIQLYQSKGKTRSMAEKMVVSLVHEDGSEEMCRLKDFLKNNDGN